MRRRVQDHRPPDRQNRDLLLQSGQYDNTPVPTVAPIANPTFTTPTLPNGTWYFVVTAYNTAGLESGYSNEVSKTIATAPEPPRNLRIWIAQAIAWILGHLRFWA